MAASAEGEGMNGCDDVLYEVTFMLPVAVRVNAPDETTAEMLAVGETVGWRRFRRNKFSVGFPLDITVKEVATTATVPS